LGHKRGNGSSAGLWAFKRRGARRPCPSKDENCAEKSSPTPHVPLIKI
jgi:hypothetical protein